MENMETKLKFIELRAKGTSYNTVSEILGVSKQTLINWSKDLKIEVSNYKALEYDDLLSKYQLNMESKLKLYKSMLSKIENELQKRDFTSIKSDKLVELYLNILESLSKNVTPVLFTEDISWTTPPNINKWEA